MACCRFCLLRKTLPHTLVSASETRSHAGIQVAQDSYRAAVMQGALSPHQRYTTVGRMNAVSEPAKEPMKPGRPCSKVKIRAPAPRSSDCGGKSEDWCGRAAVALLMTP